MKVFRWVVLVLTLLLLIALAGTHFLPLLYNQPDVISQTAQQSTRVERIAKNALILASKPGDNARAQAISELQTTLPAMEAQQMKLRSLTDTDLRTLILQSQSDYAFIDKAANNLLADPTDETQVRIILDHEQSYATLMSQVSTTRQSEILEKDNAFFLAQTILSSLIFVGIILLFIFPRQTMPIPIKEAQS